MLGAVFSIVSFSSVISMELITAHSISSAEPVQLFRNHKDIFVQDENAAYRVKKYNMNPLLKEVMQRQAIGKFTEKGGYLRVRQLSNGEYLIDASVRIDGGGIAAAQAGYWLTKAVILGAQFFLIKKTAEKIVGSNYKETPVGNMVNAGLVMGGRKYCDIGGVGPTLVSAGLEKCPEHVQKNAQDFAMSITVTTGAAQPAFIEAASMCVHNFLLAIPWLP